MNFVTSQQEVAAQLGLDNTVSSQNTLIERWLNTSQQMIAEAYEWPFLRASSPLIIQTVPDVTTATANTTAGSSAVSISGSPSTSATGFFLQTSSSLDWYKITAHIGGTSSLTIDPAAIYTGSNLTSTIRKTYYSTSSSVDRILSMRQAISPIDLSEISAEQFFLFRPDMNASGNPRLFYMLGKDSSDIWQFGLWPIPSTMMNIHIEYIKTVTDLIADTDTSVIPSKWHTNVLLKGAIWQGLNFSGDSRANSARDEFYAGIEEMKKQNTPSKRTHRVMSSVEDTVDAGWSPLGGNYSDSFPYGI